VLLRWIEYWDASDFDGNEGGDTARPDWLSWISRMGAFDYREEDGDAAAAEVIQEVHRVEAAES
jgi:hypothetical protein